MSRGKRCRPRPVRRSRWPVVLLAAVLVAAAAVWGVPKLLERTSTPVSAPEPLPLDTGAKPEEPPAPEPAPAPPESLPDPEPAPDPAEELLAVMTLREKIGRAHV